MLKSIEIVKYFDLYYDYESIKIFFMTNKNNRSHQFINVFINGNLYLYDFEF